MTLSQAARTGRDFWRKGEESSVYRLSGKLIFNQHPGQTARPAVIDAEMLCATDWETAPLRLEVTEADIIRAARQLDDLASKRRLSAAEFGKLICLELGLTEQAS